VTVCATDAGSSTTRLARPPASTVRGPWQENSIERLHLRVFPNLSNALAYRAQLFLPIGMRRYLTEHAGDFDLAHLHACRNVPGVLAARALVRAHVPYVLAPNGTAVNIERLWAAKWAFDVVMGRRVLDEAARLIAVTTSEHRELVKIGVAADRIDVVPNPVALEEFAAPGLPGGFRRRHGLSSRPLVVFLGKLTPRKKVDVLARAFAHLRWPGARLVIAGNDMGAGRVLRGLVSSLGIAGSTIFTGLVTGAQRLELLADADVVVYASEHEIFGLVPLEALMCGAPVIVGNDSGCGEIVGTLGGGVVLPAGEVDSLTTALRVVLKDSDRWRAAARRAAGRVRDLYRPDVVCQQLERTYSSVLTARIARA
jgi:glycosyltransferase involved in cell wall biosynthesis